MLRVPLSRKDTYCPTHPFPWLNNTVAPIATSAATAIFHTSRLSFSPGRPSGRTR